ncbi:MAG TPA: DNA replication and repair protein RecF [Thermoanaerobaculia bacterium]|nr:DNA replication and repair protein RecF [Thermoanaerobaculia bacterium]
MILRTLEARNFRNLEEAQVAFHPEANLIIGDNGQGKTNLLEAIYFLATTRSFRTARTTNLIRLGAPSLFVRGTIEERDLQRVLSIGIEAASERRRELRINEEKVQVHRYASVLHLFAYSASRLEIVRGGPEERRRFLDRGIATIQPGYLKELTRYGRSLQQRNALLQKISTGEASPKLLDAWDQELVTAAMPVVEARARYTTSLVDEFRRVVSAHDYHVKNIEITYQPSGFDPGCDPAEALRELGKNRPRELAAGFTVVGPHRDTLAFEVEGRPAADLLSSGEIKMTVLFLKFAKIAIYRALLEARPLFLLDDIDAELDLKIMERLLRYVEGSVQIFATSAKPSVFSDLLIGPHEKISLRSGAVTR